MVAIKECIIGDSVLDSKFCCDLNVCKGLCCVEGDQGAPLEIEEMIKIEEIFPEIKKYMTDEGINAVEEYGVSSEENGDIFTTLINNKECAFICFEDDGTASCAIEKAYNNGDIDFKKPLSCHLYPIRIKSYPEFDAINYHEWHICRSGCKKGKELNLSLIDFLKEPIIRKYGNEWFESLKGYLKK